MRILRPVPRVRLAEEADAPVVARLLVQLPGAWGAQAPALEDLERGVRRLMADPDTEYLLAGEPASAVAQLRYRFLIWTDSDECELEDLFVSEEARRTGLGRELVEAGVERARARGCGRMHIVANGANPPAIALYESLGFSAFFDPPGGNNLALRRSL